MKTLARLVLYSIMGMLLGAMCLVEPSLAEEEKKSIMNNDTTELILQNDSGKNQIFGVVWKNHPHGCFYGLGVRVCDFTKAGGSMSPNENFTTEILVGGVYCVDWDNQNYNERTEESEKEYCFEAMDQNPIIVTTKGIQEVLKHPVTIKNCRRNSWVGLAKWLDDEEGNHIDYEAVPEAELKSLGTKVIMLSEGSYAGTHYRPPQTKTIDGVKVRIFGAILKFHHELIVDGPTTFEFGDCETLMNRSL